MDNPEALATLSTQVTGQRVEKTEETIKNGQHRDTGNIQYPSHRTKVRITKGTIKNGQPRGTGNIEHTSHRTKVEKTKGTIKNGQPRDTGNIEYTSHRTKGRENQRDNQEWTTQRHWQHWVHKSQDKG